MKCTWVLLVIVAVCGKTCSGFVPTILPTLSGVARMAVSSRCPLSPLLLSTSKRTVAGKGSIKMKMAELAELEEVFSFTHVYLCACVRTCTRNLYVSVFAFVWRGSFSTRIHCIMHRVAP